jgi:hypothetical protein
MKVLSVYKMQYKGTAYLVMMQNILKGVLPCSNYDSTNLRNYLPFEITFVDAFRLLLCKPSSRALDFPHFLGFFPVLFNTI